MMKSIKKLKKIEKYFKKDIEKLDNEIKLERDTFLKMQDKIIKNISKNVIIDKDIYIYLKSKFI